MRVELELDLDLSITVEFDYAIGSVEKFSGRHGNWLPGEPAEINIIKVMIGTPKTPLDITKSLIPKDLATIRKACWDSVCDGET